MKVLFTINYGEEKFNKIKELGYDVIFYPPNNIENNDEINSADVLVTYNPFKTLDISQMKNLKYIQTSSIGIDQIPKDEVIKRNIKVCNNRGGYSIPMGEWIVMYILSIYKNSINLYNQQVNKVWKTDFSVEEISGKKIGFIGTGTIAIEAAKRLKGFDVEIWGVNTSGSTKEYFDRSFKLKDIDEVLINCDTIISILPSTKETLGLLGKEKFELMKDGSVFINVGRGDSINENDLIENISKFRGVALDVFEEEPLSKDSKLWEFENVTITPHNSWVSSKNRDRTFERVYINLKNYIENKPLTTIVDMGKGY